MQSTTAISLRKPCHNCGHDSGYVETKNGQDCVYCWLCSRWQYNAPKVETGRDQRTVATVHEGLSAKKRARVILRATGRCELCGRRPNGVEESLHVAHLLSVKDGLNGGLDESTLNSDENLAALCDTCNLGIGKSSIPVRVVVAILKARTKSEPSKED